MIFLLKLLRLKIYFHSPSGLGQVLFITLELIPSHESLQSLQFSSWLKYEAIFCQTKGSSHEINLLCVRKCDYETEESRLVLAPITDTIVTL